MKYATAKPRVSRRSFHIRVYAELEINDLLWPLTDCQITICTLRDPTRLCKFTFLTDDCQKGDSDIIDPNALRQISNPVIGAALGLCPPIQKISYTPFSYKYVYSSRIVWEVQLSSYSIYQRNTPGSRSIRLSATCLQHMNIVLDLHFHLIQF